MRRRESLSVESLLIILERNTFLVLEPPFTYYSSPLKRATKDLENINKNAEVSVPESSPLFPIFIHQHRPYFLLGQSQKYN